MGGIGYSYRKSHFNRSRAIKITACTLVKDRGFCAMVKKFMHACYARLQHCDPAQLWGVKSDKHQSALQENEKLNT